MAPQRQLATPAYLVGLALIFIPLVDVMTQVFPFRLADPRWRFGTYGLLSNALMIEATGLLILFLLTTLFDHRRVQKVLGAIALLGAVVVGGLFVIFALDALQVRPGINPVAAVGFKVAAVTASLKTMLGILTFGAFGWAAFRTPKLPRPAASSRPNTLIIGSSSGLRPAATTPPQLPSDPTRDTVGDSA